MRRNLIFVVILGLVFGLVLVYKVVVRFNEFAQAPSYKGGYVLEKSLPKYDSSKKNVVIVVNNEGTELFDMMAPFYLFNATNQANVYVVAKSTEPVVLKKGVFILPHFTFAQLDSAQIKPDVIVIPFLGVIDSMKQQKEVLSWIRANYTSTVKVLAICDGSSTAAATGVFDGRSFTAHASDLQLLKKQYLRTKWVENISVVINQNLYSSAGVSNATEGCMVVIRDLFGQKTMDKVMADISYPYKEPKMSHVSNKMTFADQITLAKKIVFGKGIRIGLLLENGVDEFLLGGVLDTYNRTFPISLESFSLTENVVKSKYGLSIIPTTNYTKLIADEIFVFGKNTLPKLDVKHFAKMEFRYFQECPQQYVFEKVFDQITKEYGETFATKVKKMLDYN